VVSTSTRGGSGAAVVRRVASIPSSWSSDAWGASASVVVHPQDGEQAAHPASAWEAVRSIASTASLPRPDPPRATPARSAPARRPRPGAPAPRARAPGAAHVPAFAVPRDRQDEGDEHEHEARQQPAAAEVGAGRVDRHHHDEDDPDRVVAVRGVDRRSARSARW
jgi:hypothetical protein